MNKKIKELADQSNITEIIDECYMERGDWSPFVKKFAELIVRECASRVDHILREKSLGGGTYADDIKQHFGIE